MLRAIQKVLQNRSLISAVKSDWQYMRQQRSLVSIVNPDFEFLLRKRKYDLNSQRRFRKPPKYSRQNRKTGDIDDDDDDDEEDEDLFYSDDEDNSYGRGAKVVQLQTTSMRLDIIVKHALGYSRNNIDVMFYESRIRVNDEKVLKKSEHISIGDKIDVIKDVSADNPNFLTVSRLEIISAKATNEAIVLKVRKIKSLLIEDNLENRWKKPI